jgi:hypothetical protein
MNGNGDRKLRSRPNTEFTSQTTVPCFLWVARRFERDEPPLLISDR